MITKYPSPILFADNDPVEMDEAKEIDSKLRNEIKIITWGKVLGLASPQIGINKKVFIALDKTYINPLIIYYSNDKAIMNEGCYSLKENKFDYPVERSKAIRICWTDLKGKNREGLFRGLQAQVLQHEYDHLLGKLCCQS